MKTDHAHVEAAVTAALMIGVLSVVDLFLDVADNHPLKLPFYFAVFFMIYFVARVIYKRRWS